MSPGGRRPGNVDTRQDIVVAARRVFADKGYDQASLRGIAREAGVDAALVHHYFDGKSDLFMAAMSLPFDPRTVKHDTRREDAMTSIGTALVEGFLTMWDKAQGSASSFASCVVAMGSAPEVADAVREFVGERLWGEGPVPGPEEDPVVTAQRRALISSQLMGLAFNRYVLSMPPISTATPHEIAQWAGPTIDRYMADIRD